jgi:lactoylglutathione lyase
MAAASSNWLAEDKRLMLHAVYRVGDLDKTEEYYKKMFGMKRLRYRDQPDDKYTNLFMGYGPEDQGYFSLELTYNYGKESYDVGEGFGHFALAVPDVYKAVDDIKAAGGTVTRDAGPVKGGTTEIAFVEDPTGYKYELIQRPEHKGDRILHMMFRVKDLEASKQYYTEALGMKLLREKENEKGRYTNAFLGYGDDSESVQIELTYNWESRDYNKGDGYAQIAISTTDVFKTMDQIKAAGGKITKEAGALPGLGTKIMATIDPDGYKIVFVDYEDLLAELK